jgi:hypothetical protein
MHARRLWLSQLFCYMTREINKLHYLLAALELIIKFSLTYLTDKTLGHSNSLMLDRCDSTRIRHSPWPI